MQYDTSDYTFPEWMDHAKLLESLYPSVQEFFEQEYSTLVEASYKLKRFWMARTYLEKNIEKFDSAGFALTSSRSKNATGILWAAAWRYYSNASEQKLGQQPAVEDMVRWTREVEHGRSNPK